MATPDERSTYERLLANVRDSRAAMLPFRENRLAAIKQYVGTHYSNDGAGDRVPVNFLELGLNIYQRNLVAQGPTVAVTTEYFHLRPQALDLQAGMKQLLEEIRFSDTLRRGVLDAMFTLAIVKVGLTRRGQVDIDGVTHDETQVFADLVQFDNFVHDMKADIPEKCQFVGDRYELPLDYVLSSGLYDNVTQAKAKETTDGSLRNDGGVQRASQIGHGEAGEETRRAFAVVEVWDLWLPAENAVLTFLADPDTGSPYNLPIRQMEWDGPENGPYHMLSFSDVPSNLMPLAPVALWMDLHDLMNRMFRKMGRQAERSKTIMGVSPGGEGDGKRVLSASDGDMIRMDNPERVKAMTFPGVDASSLAFFLQLKDLFVYLAGNLDALGGLGPQSETLGQDEMLSASASKRLANMQDSTVDFVERVLSDVGWWLWTDPRIKLPATRRVEGTDLFVPVGMSGADREGDFYDYAFKIEPYSMQRRSPGMKLQMLGQVMERFLLPLLPMIQQQGGVIDTRELLTLLAKLANMPELLSLVQFEGFEPYQSPIVGESDQEAGGMPNHTTRRYERVNRPGATRGGKDALLTSLLSGVNVQGSEAAVAGRPVS